VNLSLGIGDALEDGDGFLLHPRRELALGDELFDRGKIPTVIMRMIVIVRFVTVFAVLMVRVVMRLVMMLVICTFVLVRMVMIFMLMIATFSVFVVMIVIVRQVNVELDARDALSLILSDVQMEAIEFQFFDLAGEFVRVNAEVQHRADKHVTANAAEDVEIESFQIGWLRS
jgi:hypothetical protein